MVHLDEVYAVCHPQLCRQLLEATLTQNGGGVKWEEMVLAASRRVFFFFKKNGLFSRMVHQFPKVRRERLVFLHWWSHLQNIVFHHVCMYVFQSIDKVFRYGSRSSSHLQLHQLSRRAFEAILCWFPQCTQTMDSNANLHTSIHSGSPKNAGFAQTRLKWLEGLSTETLWLRSSLLQWMRVSHD